MNFKDFLELSEPQYSGVYMAMLVDSPELEEYQEKFLKTNLEEELHCTLVYSNTPFIGDIEISRKRIQVFPKKFSLFGPNNDILVLEIESDYLIERNRFLSQTYGFIYNYKFKPHITLAHNFRSNIDYLPEINFPIYLDNEYFEELS